MIVVMDKALFDTESQTELSTVGTNEHEHYLAEIKRIRNEIAGFKPIETTPIGGKPITKDSKVPPKVAAKPASKVKPMTSSKPVSTGYKRSAYY